jgi:rubrerythrin
MSAMNSEPWEFASLGQLLAMARSMEQEAIDGYVALSQRMVAMARPDLAEVFDSLVREEKGHLSKVDEWRNASGQLEVSVVSPTPEGLFDDEGTGIVAPELVSAYRAFSMAVQNEERAFTFWTYVSAHARSDEIKQAAERMAREELGHVSTLRRERRKAFHIERAARGDARIDLQSLEKALSMLLDSLASNAIGEVSETLLSHALAARARMQSLSERPFEPGTRITPGSEQASNKALPVAEMLLDCYLDLGEHAKGEPDANRARRFAAQLIACIRTVRGVATGPAAD